MLRPKPDFQRRDFLRASGVAVALPLFESRSSAVADSPVSRPDAEPARMVCVGNPYGLIPDEFFPTQAGADYRVTPLLTPLERHRADFTVFSNFDHGYTGGHRVVDTFLTGVKTIDANTTALNSIKSLIRFLNLAADFVTLSWRLSKAKHF